MKDKRYFKVGQKDYYIQMPTGDVLNKADQVYASKIGELISSARKGKKILLRSQLDEFLEQEGIWTSKDEAEMLSLQIKYADLHKKLKKGGIKLSEGRAISIDMFNTTKQILVLNQRRKAFDDTTAEAIADEEQRDYVIYASTFTEPDRKEAWPSFEDMKNAKASELYQKAFENYFQLVYGNNSELLESQPEVAWLKKYGYLDNELGFIDRKTGERVDEQGNKIEVKEEKEEFQPFIDDETGVMLDENGKEIVQQQTLPETEQEEVIEIEGIQEEVSVEPATA